MGLNYGDVLDGRCEEKSPLPGAPNVGEIFPEENLPKILVQKQGDLLHDLGDGYGGGDEINQARKGTQEATQVQATMEV